MRTGRLELITALLVSQAAIYEHAVYLRSHPSDDQGALPLNYNLVLLGVADHKFMASFSGEADMGRGRKPTLLCHALTIDTDLHRAAEPIARKLNPRLFFLTDFQRKPHDGTPA